MKTFLGIVLFEIGFVTALFFVGWLGVGGLSCLTDVIGEMVLFILFVFPYIVLLCRIMNETKKESIENKNRLNLEGRGEKPKTSKPKHLLRKVEVGNCDICGSEDIVVEQLHGKNFCPYCWASTAGIEYATDSSEIKRHINAMLNLLEKRLLSILKGGRR